MGKTFLSNCIAKELMDKEYSVLYFSASKFFSSLAKHAFDKQDVDAQNMFELIYNCDCLIIDDLGTEYTNNFIASQFFTCINNDCLTAVLQLYQQTCHWTLWLIFIQNGPFPESQVIISC